MLALFVLAYLWPVLLGGKLLMPTALLSGYVPWKGVAPAGMAPYVNPELGDVPFSYSPWNLLARQLIHAGTFPAWNPYAFGGTQLWANPEVAWLSPFSLPLWILPLNFGLGVAAALKLWMAGFGTYLLVRELGPGFWAGIVAAIGFTLCAFNVVWLTYGVFISVAALLPWAIWLVERILRRGGAATGLALVAVVAAIQVGGHPGTQVHVLGAVVLYTLVRTLTIRDAERRERLRRVGLIGAAVALGTMLSAVVLLPADQAATDTVGAAVRRNGAPGIPASNMPLHMIRTALFPDWWGRPGDVIAPDEPAAHYRERTFYAGTIVLLLAGVALASGGGWRRKAPFAAIGAIGAAVALHVPGIQPFVVHLPFFDRVQDQRMVLWFLFAMSVLAAFGLQSILDQPERQRQAWAVTAAGLLGAVVAIASLGPHGDTLSQAVHYLLHRSGTTAGPALALASVGWWSVFVLAFAAILTVMRWRADARWLAGGLVALVVALDMLHFAHGYNPMGPASGVIPPTTPAIAFLQRHVGERRISGLEYALPDDYSTVYGLRDVRGQDSPQPTFRFLQLWRVIEPNAEPWGWAPLTDNTAKVMGLLGARYLMTPPHLGITSPELTLAYKGRDAAIYANRLAVRRAFVASQVHVAQDDSDEAHTIAESAFDPRRDAVVRRDDLGATATPGGDGSVRVVRDRNAEVTLHATLYGSSLVVLDDTWADGWSVRVDGKPARTLRADIALRGVVVPAGAHEIVWSYRVPGLRLGLAVSLLGLLCSLAWAGWLVRVRRSRPRDG